MPKRVKITATCSCCPDWYLNEVPVEVAPKESHAEIKAKIKRQHREDCPDCNGTIDVSIKN